MGDARQDHDDELNTRYCHVFWWIPGAQGFPLKEERNGNGNLSCIHIHVIEIILVVCMFARIGFGTVFQLDWL